ncbi:MAG: hemin uptake protein HemP [Giesbergeria sp.]
MPNSSMLTASLATSRTDSVSAQTAAALESIPMCSNSENPCFTWQSTDLLQGNKRVHIAHNGGVYQLQTTRQGKLILTK